MVLAQPPIQISFRLRLLETQHLYRQKQECRDLKHSQHWQLQSVWTQQQQVFQVLYHHLARREWISRVCRRPHNLIQQMEGLLHQNLDFRIQIRRVSQYRSLQGGIFLRHPQQIFLIRVLCPQWAVMNWALVHLQVRERL
tara:strand:- start:820 stop:1239 length:420 start_codon:yes stop_codon:yes gene_type:complete